MSNDDFTDDDVRRANARAGQVLAILRERCAGQPHEYGIAWYLALVEARLERAGAEVFLRRAAEEVLES